jgi:hypothetical protein
VKVLSPPITTHIRTTSVVIPTLVVLEAEDSELVAEEVPVTVEATGKLEEKVCEEGPMGAFFFCPIFVGSNPDFHKLLYRV